MYRFNYTFLGLVDSQYYQLFLLSVGFSTFASLIWSYCSYIKNVRIKNSRLPLGPRPFPWIGNASAFRGLTVRPRKTLQDMTKYGDMATLWLGSWPTIVINSPRVAYDLLQKSSAATSDRPMNNNFRASALPWNIFLAPAGDKFRHLRKLYHSILGQKQASMFKVYSEQETMFLLERLLEAPNDAHFECDRYSFNIMMRAIYGIRFGADKHHIIAETYSMWRKMFDYIIPGTLPFDFFPLLLKLPSWSQPWRWIIQYLKGQESLLHVEQLQRLRMKSSSSGCHLEDAEKNNFASYLLGRMEAEGLDDQALIDVLAMLLGAGSDTIGGVLQQFMKAMAVNPEAVSIAQAELDSVVGSSRLPTWKDEKNLIYVQGLIKEVHRWAPIAIVGASHAATEDIAYEGYLIPKGTIFIPNIPALMRSPERYTNPDLFQPDRFRGDLVDSAESATNRDWQQRDHVHFGWGRRLCPGSYAGEACLYLAISRILWGFNIEPFHGVLVIMEDQHNGLLKKALPFRLQITPRSTKHAHVIAQYAERQKLA